jgi:hypothetical protein
MRQRLRPILCLSALATLCLGACRDHSVAQRAAAEPAGIPDEADCRFERSDPLFPMSRVAWVDGIEEIDPYQWPESMYEDFRKNLGMKRRLGIRAPAWPTKRDNRVRFEAFREPLNSVAVTVDGRVLFVASRVIRQLGSTRHGGAGGTFHRVSVFDVANGTEHVLAENVEGAQGAAPLALRMQVFDDKAVMLFATVSAIMQVTVEPGPDELQLTRPVSVARLDEPPLDLHVGATRQHLHLAWTQGPMEQSRRTLAYTSTKDPTRGWEMPVPVATTALAGTLNLVTDEDNAFLAWADQRFGPAPETSTDAPRLMAVVHPAGGSPGAPVLLSDLTDPEDVVRRLLVTLAGEDLVVYWSPDEADWPVVWHKGLVDRKLQVFSTTGVEVSGPNLLAAYRDRMAANWATQTTRTVVGAD